MFWYKYVFALLPNVCVCVNVAKVIMLLYYFIQLFLLEAS